MPRWQLLFLFRSNEQDCSSTHLPKWETLVQVRVIAKSSLKQFWERPGCADARGPLHSWYEVALKARWRRPQDIKDQYASAGICGNNRVVFNVGGNKYRPVVEMQYQAGIVWVKFVGTHAQYDRIDVETVNDY
jgi:mRNA interferase HigB